MNTKKIYEIAEEAFKDTVKMLHETIKKVISEDKNFIISQFVIFIIIILIGFLAFLVKIELTLISFLKQ